MRGEARARVAFLREHLPRAPAAGAHELDPGSDGARRARGRREMDLGPPDVLRFDDVEVDLVARKGRVVALVEVKTRRSSRYGPPELAVDHRKQQRLIRAAQA